MDRRAIDNPCMDYLPTGEEWPHSRGNVDTYDIYLTWMVWLWLINQPPLTYPSQKQGFNKALFLGGGTSGGVG